MFRLWICLCSLAWIASARDCTGFARRIGFSVCTGFAFCTIALLCPVSSVSTISNAFTHSVGYPMHAWRFVRSYGHALHFLNRCNVPLRFLRPKIGIPFWRAFASGVFGIRHFCTSFIGRVYARGGKRGPKASPNMIFAIVGKQLTTFNFRFGCLYFMLQSFDSLFQYQAFPIVQSAGLSFPFVSLFLFLLCF